MSRRWTAVALFVPKIGNNVPFDSQKGLLKSFDFIFAESSFDGIK